MSLSWEKEGRLDFCRAAWVFRDFLSSSLLALLLPGPPPSFLMGQGNSLGYQNAEREQESPGPGEGTAFPLPFL